MLIYPADMLYYC